MAARSAAHGGSGVAGHWGWSGNEEIIDVLDGIMFYLRFSESSHRGGRHVYEVEMAQREVVSQLGAITVEGTAGG